MMAFLYGLGGLLAIAAAQLWPKANGIWLVQMSPAMTHTAAASQLLSTSARLIDATQGRTFIIKADASLSPVDLYRMGAIVVLQANFVSGCTRPEAMPPWAKTE